MIQLGLHPDQHAAPPDRGDFVCGDALALPFGADSFAAELGGATVIHESLWFVAVSAPRPGS